jgi:hypothetical protein
MKAEDLVAFAGGHGIDLVGAAQRAVRTDGLAPPRRLTFPERLAGIPLPQPMSGSQTQVMKKAAWTEHDLGHALAGCPRMPLLAAWFAWGRDDKDFGELCRGTHVAAMRIAGIEKWRSKMIPTEVEWHYIPTMVHMVYESDRHAHLYGPAPTLYATRMGVSPEVWSSRWASRFESIRSVYQGWQEDALNYIRGSLAGRPRKAHKDVDRRGASH